MKPVNTSMKSNSTRINKSFLYFTVSLTFRLHFHGISIFHFLPLFRALKKQKVEQRAANTATIRRAKVVYSPVSAFGMDSFMPRNRTALSGGVGALVPGALVPVALVPGALVPEGKANRNALISPLTSAMFHCDMLLYFRLLGNIMTDSKPAVEFRSEDFCPQSAQSSFHEKS